MLFTELSLAGVFLIELERRPDDRGWFARSLCDEELAQHGLPTHFPQNNLSYNARQGTLRGMHYQASPHQESKLVRTIAGGIFDVVVDLRPGSASRWKWLGVELTAERGAALFIPAGCAHGFVTLADDTTVHYHMGDSYYPELARGFRWNDPKFDIRWPRPPAIIGERDAAFPDFDPATFDG